MVSVAREWWFALALGSAIMIGVAGLLDDDDRPTNADVAVIDPPRYRVSGVEWLRTDNAGAPVFRVSAPQLSMFDDERVAIDQPIIDGLGERDVWQLAAPYGEVPARSRTLTLRGGVIINGRWDDGVPLEARTASLAVDTTARDLSSDDPVQVIGDGRQLQGVGLHADWEGESIRLLDQVHARYSDGR